MHFVESIENAGLPLIRFHDIRHTVTTLMFHERIYSKGVQERLGHSTIFFTLDTYSHVNPSMQQEIWKKFDNLLLN